MENYVSAVQEQKEEDHQQKVFDSVHGEDKHSAMDEPCWLNLNRNEKRKALKKIKRKNIRKDTAIKERQEEEAKLNDPEELRKLELLEKEEEERRERVRKEFEEHEKAWIEAMEIKKKKEQEEEEQRKALEELEKKQQLSRQVENENEEGEDDGDWEYIEEGPAEIIWKGNEIIVKKKKVKVPKKDSDQQKLKQDGDRPTSNPLPPQSEAFAEYKNASAAPAQELLENVAQQVPNFGTEQDKAHCPFHLKTGACRFGQRCSRVHFYPYKSCTILIRNMYNGPGLAFEQDEGLEYSDEEVERSYEEFYEDVHTEFLKFGELVNFKVCRNGSFHLRGNVYVHYKSLESAVLAYQSIRGRYFAGKQVQCEFVNVTRWKVAICGEYMKSRYKTCSHGTACNFIHCFRNPGGDYEWADWDKQPPRFWVNKMAALFGYSEEYDYEKQMLPEGSGRSRYLGRTRDLDSKRWHSRRSASRETAGRYDTGNDFHNTSDNIEQRDHHGESGHEKRKNKYRHVNSRTDDDLERHHLSGERGRERDHSHVRERWKHTNVPEARKGPGDVEKRSDELDPWEDYSDDDKETRYSRSKRSSKHRRIEHTHNMDIKRRCDELDPYEDFSDDDKETCYSHSKRSSKHRRIEHAHNMDIKKRSDELDPYEDFSDDDKETHHSHCNRSSKHRRIEHTHNNIKKRSDEFELYEECLDDDRETYYSHSKRSLKHRSREHAHNMDIKKRSDGSDPYEECSNDDKETRYSHSKGSSKHRRIEHAHNMVIKKRSDESDPDEDLLDDDREICHGNPRKSLKLRKAKHTYNTVVKERSDELDSNEDFLGVLKETCNDHSRRSSGSNSSYLNQNIDIDDRWKPEDNDARSCWDVET